MASGGINRFYKKMKKSGVMKKSAVSDISPKDTQEDEELEERLRQFDLDMRYGPCIGMTRMERWNRANAMGLKPPLEIKDLLLRSAAGDVQAASAIPCIWDGRI